MTKTQKEAIEYLIQYLWNEYQEDYKQFLYEKAGVEDWQSLDSIEQIDWQNIKSTDVYPEHILYNVLVLKEAMDTYLYRVKKLLPNGKVKYIAPILAAIWFN